MLKVGDKIIFKASFEQFRYNDMYKIEKIIDNKAFFGKTKKNFTEEELFFDINTMQAFITLTALTEKYCEHIGTCFENEKDLKAYEEVLKTIIYIREMCTNFSAINPVLLNMIMNSCKFFVKIYEKLINRKLAFRDESKKA
jgi:hypothetical protein